MQFKIKILDNFINECVSNKKEVSFDSLTKINESKETSTKTAGLFENYTEYASAIKAAGKEATPLKDIFEAYLKYSDFTGIDMVTLLEFEKIKSFSEFVNDKEAGEKDPDSISTPDDSSSAEEPKKEEPKADETPAEEPAKEEPKTDDTTADAPKSEEPKADETPAEEPKKDEAPKEEPKKDEDGEDKDNPAKLDLSSEVAEAELKNVGTIPTPPEKIAALANTKDDAKDHAKVDLVTGDGQKTADAVAKKIADLGEPEKHNEKEGEKLVDQGTTVKDVVKEAELTNVGTIPTPPEKIAALADTKNDGANGIVIPLETGDGQKTADDVAKKIADLGKPEDHDPKEGEKLVDQGTTVKDVVKENVDDKKKV